MKILAHNIQEKIFDISIKKYILKLLILNIQYQILYIIHKYHYNNITKINKKRRIMKYEKYIILKNQIIIIIKIIYLINKNI